MPLDTKEVELGPKTGTTIIVITNCVTLAKSEQHFSDFLYGQQKHGENTDYTIISSGEEIPVHRCVMAVSPYFKALFESSMSEQQHANVILDDFSSDDIRNLIKFCYGQPLTLCYDDVCHWYEMLNYFMLLDFRDFKATAIAFLKKLIDYQSGDCIQYAKLAVRYNMADVLIELGNEVRINFTKFVARPSFQQLSCEEVTDFLCSITDTSYEDSCDTAVQGLIHWLKTQKTTDLSLSKFGDILEGCSLACLRNLSAAYKQEAFWDEGWSEKLDGLIVAKTKKRTSAFLIYDPNKTVEDVAPICGVLDFTTGVTESIPSPNSGKLISACKTPTGFAVLAFADKSEDKAACYLFNQHMTVWNQTPLAPDEVDDGTTLVATETELYLIGSCQSNRKGVYTTRIDCENAPWTAVSPMQEGAMRPLAAAINKYIYVLNIANIDSPDYDSHQFQFYNKSTRSWHIGTFCYEFSDGVSLVAVSTNLYVVGGNESKAYKYDTLEDDWTIFSLPHQRHAFGAAAYIDNSIVLCGGSPYPVTGEHRNIRGAFASDCVECYNAFTNEWEMKIVSLPKPLINHYIFPVEQRTRRPKTKVKHHGPIIHLSEQKA